jgi:hypothetical protein
LFFAIGRSSSSQCRCTNLQKKGRIRAICIRWFGCTCPHLASEIIVRVAGTVSLTVDYTRLLQQPLPTSGIAAAAACGEAGLTGNGSQPASWRPSTIVPSWICSSANRSSIRRMQ